MPRELFIGLAYLLLGIGAMAAPPAIFALLRHSFPNPSRPEGVQKPSRIDRWDAKDNARWEHYEFLVLTVLAGASTYLWWKIFGIFGHVLFFWMPSAAYRLIPSGFIWVLPAFFLGAASGLRLTNGLSRLLLKECYALYVSYRDQQSGYNTIRFRRFLFPCLVCLSILSLALFANWYAYFTEEGIGFSEPLSIRRHYYTYADVYDIRTAPRVVGLKYDHDEREMLIRFADGNRWSTYDAASEPGENEVMQLLKFVSSRSGVPVTEVASLHIDELP